MNAGFKTISAAAIGLILSFSCALFASELKKSKSEIVQRLDQLVQEVVAEHARLPDAAGKNVIAVSRFVDKSPAAEKANIGAAVSDVVQDLLMKNKDLIVIENEQVAKLVGEIEKSMTGLVDEQYAKVAGRMVAADLFLLGSVTELGNDFIVSCRLAEVETSRVLVSKQISIPKAYLVPVAEAARLEPKAPLNAGIYSLIVPGWGQFYNGRNVKGAALLSGAVVALGTLVTTRLLAYSYQKKADTAPDTDLAVRYFNTTAFLHGTANACSIVYGALLVYAVADAIATASGNNAKIREYKQAVLGGPGKSSIALMTGADSASVEFRTGF